MRIAFMGTTEFSVPILEALHQQYLITIVVTQPDRPVGRKQELTPSPVKTFALEHGLPLFQPEKIRLDYQPILEASPDVIIVAAYGQMIPDIVLNYPKYHSINVHASLLPKYRGGSPMHTAIYNGDTKTGVTIMYLAKKMDSGELLAQRAIRIEDTDNVGTLQTKLSQIGTALLMETLPSVFAQTISSVSQDESLISFAFNIKPEAERIDFHRSMKQIRDHIRAFHPWPSTHAVLDGQAIKILEVEAVPAVLAHYQGAKDGEIVKIVKNEVYVKVADGLIRLVTIQPAGRKPMSVKDYMNGLGKATFKIGKIFE
jgi:methionyl-tRNA formyltransferase